MNFPETSHLSEVAAFVSKILQRWTSEICNCHISVLEHAGNIVLKHLVSVLDHIVKAHHVLTLLYWVLEHKDTLHSELSVVCDPNEVVGLLFELALLFGFGGILIPFAIAAPLAMLFSTFAYMKIYAAYFKIEEIMIIPYKLEHPELYPEYDGEDTVMSDDVTERERLEKIKAERNSQ